MSVNFNYINVLPFFRALFQKLSRLRVRKIDIVLLSFTYFLSIFLTRKWIKYFFFFLNWANFTLYVHPADRR